MKNKIKVIDLKRKDIDYKDYVKRGATEDDFSTLITESCIGVEDGEIKFVYDIYDEDTTDVINAVKAIKFQTSKRTGGLLSTSRIFGYRPRNVLRADYCSATSLAYEDPKNHEIVASFAGNIERYYKNRFPGGWEKHRKMTTEKIKPSYQIKGSVFTSGIINKNNKLNYHFDAGNFKNVYSCMIVFKDSVGGGYLSLPEYDLGLALPNNAMLMFDGQSILHGVTPIKYEHDNAYRYSIVYYSLNQIWNCLELDDELARIRNVKTKRERERLSSEKMEKLKNNKKKKNGDKTM